MVQQYDVTSVGVNPAADRAHRMYTYFIAMSIRVLCVLSLIWVRGWWILLVGLGAVLLPMFAVMVANAVANNPGGEPTRPTPLALRGAEAQETSDHEAPRAAETIIVVDAPADRRSSEAQK